MHSQPFRSVLLITTPREAMLDSITHAYDASVDRGVPVHAASHTMGRHHNADRWSFFKTGNKSRLARTGRRVFGNAWTTAVMTHW
jgi:hypothetical protein